jgi:RND family efflux transporter MFP subunit
MSAAQAAASFGGTKGVSRPSHDSTMSFTFPVEIAEILVKGGQNVKKGDLLIRGRDDEYRLQRDLQKVIAESDLDVQRAQAAVDQSQVEFDGQQAMLDKSKGTSKVEYDRARTTLIARQVDLEIAKLNVVQQRIQLELRQAQLERLVMRAPFDGRIDKVSADIGEVKRETEPVVRIVSTNPLWIDVNPPTHETMNLALKPGDKAWVLLDLPTKEPSVYIGTVIEIAADANFGANTRRVRVELDNPRDWPSGVTSHVRFTQPSGEWAARIVDPQDGRAVAGSDNAKGGAAQ